ncbi:MAG: carbon-nitrogen hydrolase [Terriglobales bacterium]|jgi:N-carbamoylputrescine amidase
MRLLVFFTFLGQVADLPIEHYTVGLIQMASSPDAEDNLRRALDFVCRASEQGAQVVCLPELFRTQYFCQREDAKLFDLAEPVPGPTTERMAVVARKKHVAIVLSVFERRAPGLCHNSVVMIEPDGSLGGIYRKMHIPDDPLYYEKYYFTPGDLGYKVFDFDVPGSQHPNLAAPAEASGGPAIADGQQPTTSSLCRIGTLICWDQWYPEAARLTAMQGAQVVFYPTSIGWHPAEKDEFGATQLEAWRTIQRAHAIANGVYVAAVNRVGHEHGNVLGSPAAGAGLEFWGNSFLCDPFGQVVAEAADGCEQILIGEIDLKRIDEVRRNWPFLRDRRIDSYGEICRRFLDGRPS